MRMILALLFAVSLAAGAAAQTGGSASRRARAEDLADRGARLFAAGDRVSAAGYFRDAIAADPSFGEGYVGLGQLELARGRLTDARATFEAGLEHAPGTLPLWLGIAEVLTREGRSRSVRELLARMAVRFASEPRAFRERARFAERLFAWPEALAAYRGLLALADDGITVDPTWQEEAREHVAALSVILGDADPLSRCSAGSSAVRAALCGH